MRNKLQQMRKLAILFFILLISIGVHAQIPIEGVSSYIKGYWGDWRSAYLPMLANGNYGNIVLYPKGNHPSDYCVHLKIDGFNDNINKKEKKRRIKTNESYQYNGMIEIYLADTTPNLLDWVKTFGSLTTPDANFQGATKFSFPAIIKIKPYKDNPELYMVYFENLGIAFTF